MKRALISINTDEGESSCSANVFRIIPLPGDVPSDVDPARPVERVM